MDVLHPRSCGLDVHKSSISACILLREAGRVQKHQRRFGAMTQELQELAEWLRQFGVTQVAMESSGVYWKPVWNILEGQFTVVLANAQPIKNVPGRKTDQKDAEWIAQLLQYGLLRASYIPCEIIRDLRDLTRMRASLSQEASRISSRIQKVLEDANVKLASVATNVLGKSGRAMLEDIITGEDNPEHLASLALGHLRVKIPQLRLALEGKIRSHHRFLLRRLLDQIQFVEHEIALLDERLEDIGRQRPDLAQAVARWDTIPGIDRVAAWALLAEIGDNMAQFPTAEHLASWAALCPGNHESAGKRLRGTTRQGSPWLCRMGLSVRLGCRANQEHLLVLAVQTLSGKTRPEKSHHRGGAYPHRYWLSLAEESEQLRGSWRKLLRSHPLRRSQAVFGEAAPTTRAQGNPRADGSCLTHRFPQLFSREKAGLRRDAVGSQVIDVLEAQEIKETGNEED